MTLPRKVFVASKLTQDAINETFQWPDGFERTIERDEAEFIVLDVGNLPDRWYNYVAEKPDHYVPTQNLPVLFVALGDKVAPQFDDIKKSFEPIEPPVYHSPPELFFALQWLQRMFPFYNQTKIPDFEKWVLEIVLTTSKAKAGR
jgi:hypothetical protein